MIPTESLISTEDECCFHFKGLILSLKLSNALTVVKRCVAFDKEIILKQELHTLKHIYRERQRDEATVVSQGRQ